MPQTIALLPLIAASSATTVLAANAIYLGVSAALYVGASVGLSLIASAFAPRQQSPRPEDVQQSTKQPTSPRYRHYGRVKATGNWVYANTATGNFHKVLAVGQGPIDAVEEYWIDANHVTINPADNSVNEAPYAGGGEFKVKYFVKLGTDTQTAFSELTTAFPTEWTSTHAGKGIVSIYTIQYATDSKFYLNVFPNGINTNYRIVIRGVLIENPNTYAIAWDDNAASIIRDYIYNAEGMRLPKSLLMTPLAIAGWQLGYAKANVQYTVEAGGTESRYRLWGSYTLNERPADVLTRMLVACDARLKITNDGGLTIDIGDYVEPTVTIDGSYIVGFSDVGRGRDVLTTANTVRSQFINPNQDYQASDADAWVDAEDVSLRGEISTSQDFLMAPSHSQCRRLMKITAYRSNPNWIGSFVLNLKGLAAFNERFVRINYPAFGINEVFEVLNFAFDVGDNNILKTVTIQVSSMPQAAYNWDASQEEGDAPVSDIPDTDNTIPIPTNFNATIQRKTVNSQLYPYALLTFDPPSSAALKIKARGKLTTDTDWTVIAVSDGATSAESFLLADNQQYEFQIAQYSYSENSSSWTSSIILTAVADPTPPGIVTSLVATGGTGQVALTWTSPNSANYSSAHIRRNTVNTEGTATLVRTEYGPASTPDSWTNTGLTAGTYYYWVKSANASGVESASVATGAVVVT